MATLASNEAAKAALTEVGERLAARAAHAWGLAAAITAGDAEQARTQHEHLRGGDLHAILSPLQQQLAREPGAITAEILASIRVLAGDVRQADAAVAAALTNAAAANVPLWLLARGEITDAALDGLMVAPWNKDRDLIVLTGDGAYAAGERLVARGQGRVLVLDPTRPESAPALEGMEAVLWNVHGRASIERVTSLFGWPLPGQFRVAAAGPNSVLTVPELGACLTEALQFAGVGQLQILEEAAFFALKASRNLAPLARTPSAASLKGVLGGRTAVVVSAGPSLDKNIDQLKDLQGRAVIIAINQTVAGLRRAGIRADLVVTVDPLNVSYHFEETRPGDIGTLFLGASVDPSLYRVPCEQVVNFSPSPLVEQWIYDFLGEDAAVGSGGTVSTGAVKLAAWLGCTTIISVGRDLAMAGDKYYATSSADGGQNVTVSGDGQQISFASYTRKLRLADGGGDAKAVQALLESQVYQLVPVKGFFGGTVTTTNLFIHEIEQLRRTVASLPHIRFINATEGGAFLEGMEHMTLREALAGLPAGGAIDATAAIARALPGAEALAARTARMATALAGLHADVTRAHALAIEAEALCAAGSPPRLAEVGAELAAISKARPFLSLLVQFATRTIVQKGGPGFASLDDVAQAERTLYGAIRRVTEPLLREVATALADLTTSSRAG